MTSMRRDECEVPNFVNTLESFTHLTSPFCLIEVRARVRIPKNADESVL